MEGQWKGKAESRRRCETLRKEGHEGAKPCHGSWQREGCALPWANFGFNLSFRGCVKFGFFLGEAASCLGLSPGG